MEKGHGAEIQAQLAELVSLAPRDGSDLAAEMEIENGLNRGSFRLFYFCSQSPRAELAEPPGVVD